MSSNPVLIQVPYDSGNRGLRMGAGPLALDLPGPRKPIEAPGWRAELATAFELQRRVAVAAAEVRAAGDLPVLLSGNCNTTLGMLAAAPAGRRTGLVWLDAHADFNTPDTDASGFLDGQGLAMAVGRCWPALTATVPGFRPVPEERVLLVGARDLDPAEEVALRGSSVTWVRPSLAGLREAVAALDVDEIHLHVDLDVYDPSIAPANGWAVPGGLSTDDGLRVVREVTARFPVVSAAFASYDPSGDPEGRLVRVAAGLLEELTGGSA